ncbi:MAG: glycosyltransferase family 2 protein [Lachnospiraceae bacterium]|nr:glycosyltransferase family 2 protein [Lachnospiraceae bacterium]
MKLLTFAVPCYNSAAYMKKCIDSLLYGGEDVEIIIVNDGSSDDTAKIGEEYVKRYPTICRLINKENGGHGSAVNKGIEEATGLFFKVVDSDDWVKESAYKEILDVLKQYAGGSKVLDMLISNFVYDKVGEDKHKVMRYKHALPENQLFTWNDVKHFRKGQYILMHSVIFRTKLLRECGVKLPEHTFYVDNIYVFEPMLAVENMYYLDVNFYRYFIGRDDQSVNEQIMISRIDQQIRVNKIMYDFYVDNWNKIKLNSKRQKYMFNYLEIITVISSILMAISGTEENLQKRAELWKYIKERNYMLYRKLRYGFLGGYVNLPGKGGRKISVDGYKIVRRFFNFN